MRVRCVRCGREYEVWFSAPVFPTLGRRLAFVICKECADTIECRTYFGFKILFELIEEEIQDEIG